MGQYFGIRLFHVTTSDGSTMASHSHNDKNLWHRRFWSRRSWKDSISSTNDTGDAAILTAIILSNLHNQHYQYGDAHAGSSLSHERNFTGQISQRHIHPNLEPYHSILSPGHRHADIASILHQCKFHHDSLSESKIPLRIFRHRHYYHWHDMDCSPAPLG